MEFKIAKIFVTILKNLLRIFIEAYGEFASLNTTSTQLFQCFKCIEIDAKGKNRSESPVGRIADIVRSR